MRRLWRWDLLPLAAVPLIGGAYLLVQAAPLVALLLIATGVAAISRLQ